ncbi:zf-HC2 domain-containing protein [Baekduia sp. Peel2402]|uniref:zf-HC2 domain-containing protein n=1 Tax=Baekduia sp. Peel2402 TaxID=3458296 RepID=UPI00403E8BE7
MAVNEALEYMPLDGRLGSAAMEGSSDKGVTPEGVKAGDRAALAALVERRGPAVVAFCTQVCGPRMADRAAAEAFARFRAAVRDAPDLTALDPEGLLRGATRHAAASLARQPSGPPPSGKLRSRGTQTCQHVPTMLAARANGALGKADLERLARHLERCERCDALAEIFRRAELAYQDPAVDTLGTDTSSVLIEALEAVSLTPHGVAPAPAPDAPVGETLTGAYPQLPDLDDEVPIVVEVPVPAAVEAETPADAEADALLEDVEAGVAAPLDAGDELDFGATAEWNNELPDAIADEHDALPEAEPGTVLTGGKKARRSGARPLVILLPVLLVLALGAAAAALGGVFSGDDGAATVSKPPAPQVEAPVTTPLPIKVKAKAKTTTSTTAATGTTTAEQADSLGTSAPEVTDATGTTP